MFGSNRAKARIVILDEQLTEARSRLAVTGQTLDKAIADTSVQEMMRRALAKLEKTNAPPPE